MMKGCLVSSGVTRALLFVGLSTAYYNQDICPLPCSEVAYFSKDCDVYASVSRLAWCNQTMLVNFNIYNDINNPDSHNCLATCSYTDLDAGVISSRCEICYSVARQVNTTGYSNSTLPSNSIKTSLQNSTAAVQV